MVETNFAKECAVMRAMVAVVAGGAMALAIAASALPGSALAADPAEEMRIVEIVEKLLRERPELVVEALTAYQARQEQAEQLRQKEMLAVNSDNLFDRPGDPFIGNPKGTVTLVEFFDYRCGYCKRVTGDVAALVESNKDLKIVFKEFPILGDPSVLASRVSLAVNLVAPEKYGEFHKKLMTGRGGYDQASLLKLAAALGIDAAAVEAKLDDKAVTTAIAENYQLAEQLGIRGTPAFVIGDRVVPGAADRATLERLIREARG
jgi:protein-disulfide isomerase